MLAVCHNGRARRSIISLSSRSKGRYPGHVRMLRSLYDLGLFSSVKRVVNGTEVAPRQMMSRLFEEKFTSQEPEVTLLRVEAHRDEVVASFSMMDYTDPVTGTTSMMRTTAWPASIVLQMLIGGEISKRGAVRQEVDIPAQLFLNEMALRDVVISYRIESVQEFREGVLAAAQEN